MGYKSSYKTFIDTLQLVIGGNKKVGIELIKPGVRAEDVDREVLSIIEDAGYT